MKRKKWTIKNLERAVKLSTSYRQVIAKLGLVEAGGNYEQVKKYISVNSLDISHFKGRVWNKGLKLNSRPILSLDKILVENSNYQSYKLKKRLFSAKLKEPKCEKCGWSKVSLDGRIPIELDHINGDRHDNRISNLRILCPNCHSMEPTHRGLNIKKARVV